MKRKKKSNAELLIETAEKTKHIESGNFFNGKNLNPPVENIRTDNSDQIIYDKVYGKSLDSFPNFILSLFGFIKR